VASVVIGSSLPSSWPGVTQGPSRGFCRVRAGTLMARLQYKSSPIVFESYQWFYIALGSASGYFSDPRLGLCPPHHVLQHRESQSV